MNDTTPDLILQTAAGFMMSKHLFAANDLGLFEKLADRPLTLDELAKDLSIPPRTARITADAMVALGFLEKQDDLYINSSVSQTFLSGKTPADLRPFLRFWNHISYPQWQNLEEALRTNRGVGAKWTSTLSSSESSPKASLPFKPDRRTLCQKSTTSPATERCWISVGELGNTSCLFWIAFHNWKARFSSCRRSPRLQETL